jgi:hypothetical protein
MDMTFLAETGNSIQRQLANAGEADIFAGSSKIGQSCIPILCSLSPVIKHARAAPA